MSAPLQDEASPARILKQVRAGLGFFVAGLAYWAPVLLAFGFFTHVALKSLRPALDEQRRLEVKAQEMSEHEAEQADRQHALEVELEALEDPIYQERVRRAALYTDSAPQKVTSEVPFAEDAPAE